MAEHDVEKIWHDFWMPIMDQAEEEVGMTKRIREGDITLPRVVFDQIKRELYDYHNVLQDLPLLYDSITFGRVSKPNTDKRVIADLVEERVMEAYNQGYDDGLSEGQEPLT